MKIIGKLFSSFWCKLKRTFNVLYSNGLKDILINKRFKKAIVDVLLCIAWLFCLSIYGSNTYITILGVAIVMAVMSMLFNIEGESFLADMLNPFITMAVYALSAFIFFWYIDVALVLGFILIPNVTNEISTKYKEYANKELSECHSGKELNMA